VLDPGNGRVTRYRTEDGSFQADGQLPGAWSNLGAGRNLCAIGDRLFIRGVRDGRLVHEVGPDGAVLRSFEDAEVADPDVFGPFAVIAEPQLNAGQLLCLADRGWVVSFGTRNGILRAFTTEGSLVWERTLSGIRPMRLVVSNGSLTSEVDPEQGSHLGRSIVRWSPESLLVQFAWFPEPAPPPDRDFHRLESLEVSLDGASGEDGVVGWSDELPLVLEARGDRIYAAEQLPFPRVRVLERR
jgi:hypothetical protein